MTNIKERKICSFTQPGNRLQLIELIYENTGQDINTNGEVMYYDTFKYQVRLNRKIIDTSISEYTMRKLFAEYCQNIVLQLKIY